MHIRSRAATSALLASFVSLAMLPSAVAQEAINSNGWYKACSDQGENKICNVQYQAVASTGQVITSVNLAEITGKVERKVFQITVPTGRLIRPGLKMKIDTDEESRLPYSFCTPRICAAEFPLDDTLVNALKAGTKIDVTSVNWQGKENPIEITLDGFVEAYDGAPIKPEELAQRQKNLEEQLKAKSSDILQKLQEAQDAARDSGGTASE